MSNDVRPREIDCDLCIDLAIKFVTSFSVGHKHVRHVNKFPDFKHDMQRNFVELIGSYHEYNQYINCFVIILLSFSYIHIISCVFLKKIWGGGYVNM